MADDSGSDPRDVALLRTLRDGLTSGEGLEGGRLPSERDLAARLKVSRTRLRRALQQLERSGAIFRRQGQGTFVVPPPIPHAPRLNSLAASVTPHQVMEVRLEVEPALAALAARRALSSDISRLVDLGDAMREWRSAEHYERADDVFHYKIAQMASNPLFLSIFEEIRAVRRGAAWTTTGRDDGDGEAVERTTEQHARIVRAIATGDPAGAAASMRDHLVSVLSTFPE